MPLAERLTKGDLTRERILDAAAEVFREKGFAKARLQEVAARAELRVPSLYYYFPNKERLMEEVLAAGVSRTSARVREAVASANGDPLDKLEAAIEAFTSSVLEIGNYAVVSMRFFAQMPKDIYRRHLSQQREFGAFWAGLLEDAQKRGFLRADLDLHASRMLLLGALNWTAEWYRPGQERLSIAEIAHHAATIILEGMATPEAREERERKRRAAVVDLSFRRNRERDGK
jgi:AcrR family transcriptional regulator